MTKGKKTMSKTNDSTSKNLWRAHCFRRGETDQVQDVDTLNLDSIEETVEDIASVQNLPRPVEIPIVNVTRSYLHQFHYFNLFRVSKLALQSF